MYKRLPSSTYSQLLLAAFGVALFLVISIVTAEAGRQSSATQSTETMARVFPADGEVITSSQDYSPLFTWMPVAGAEWYHVYVATADYRLFTFDQWYEASEVCDAELCTAPDEIWVPYSADYIWWMGYWNQTVGSQYIQTYTQTTFNVNMPYPQGLNVLYPPGDSPVPTSNASLRWEDHDDVLWYHIWAGRSDGSLTAYHGWASRLALCDDGVCSVDLPVDLAEGEYQWWVELWGPGGYVRWSLASIFEVRDFVPTPTQTPTMNLTSTPSYTPTVPTAVQTASYTPSPVTPTATKTFSPTPSPVTPTVTLRSSKTPSPTSTSSPSPTATASITPSLTPTSTDTPVPFACDDLGAEFASTSGSSGQGYVELEIYNYHLAQSLPSDQQVRLTRVDLIWTPPVDYESMFLASQSFNNQNLWFDATATGARSSDGSFIASGRPQDAPESASNDLTVAEKQTFINVDRRVPPLDLNGEGEISYWNGVFFNAPPNFDTVLPPSAFSGTTFYFFDPVSGQECIIPFG